MKSLKIIPAFFLLIVLTYFGVQFVEANREEVSVNIATWQSRPLALGLVLITSFFFGTLFAALLSATELLRIYVQLSRLKKKNQELLSLPAVKDRESEGTNISPFNEPQNPVPKPTGRFS